MPYALVQGDLCVFGVGPSEEAARADAALFIDIDFDDDIGIGLSPQEIADAAPLVSASGTAMRDACQYAKLVLVECSEALAAKVKADGGDISWSVDGRKIVLDSEAH